MGKSDYSSLIRDFEGVRNQLRYIALRGYRTRTEYYNICVKEKDYDGIESYFTNSLMKQKTTLGKVIDNSVLGEYYFEIKDYSKSKKCFDFFIEHGNKLHCVSEAKKYNKKIENK